MTPESESTAVLRAAVDRLLARVGHWTPARWAQRGAAPIAAATRGDFVFDLVQQLADAAADAEGQPRRRVPRLDNDLALPDQVRVMVADLLAAGASDGAIRAAAARVQAVAAAL